ncbi:methyltransferase [Aaosphaeria arxii CBS 175.79]|uniref:Methyltransferase n=1 Tax=Aaosphaeria arxii CBS 175.79 TaxID=1450172 RepID=A0A6A5XMF1_9PLEO|nr:methyltransferase [Aaosphaeria arxii CBS 175.79]KAF2014418.1 methyltransferase [Aaosphaeria arxii CBS 175.79]
MASVQACMSFLEPWPSTAEKESPYVRGIVEEQYPSTNFKNEDQTVQFTDARLIKELFTLDNNGFAWTNSSALPDQVLDVIRSKEKERVMGKYYPLVEKLLKDTLGATHVIIFDHTYRKRDPSLDLKANPNEREQPATVAHCDQSALGASRRVERHAGDDAERLLKGRCQLINVWRPISGVVEDWPLAMMDFRSMKPSEVHPTNIFRQAHDFIGQTVGINYSPEQKWYYLEKQTPEEVTLIKIWDNKDDVANMCAHSAFQHPDHERAIIPRESIEVRCLVFYENS